MYLAGEKRAEARNESNILNYASALCLVALLSPAIYFASIAPAFKMTANTEGIVRTKEVRRLYRPLFDHAPRMTRSYLELCGVSDLEIFFVLQPAQGESP